MGSCHALATHPHRIINVALDMWAIHALLAFRASHPYPHALLKVALSLLGFCC